MRLTPTSTWSAASTWAASICRAPDDARLAIDALLEFAAGAHDLRQADDRIVRGLTVDFGQHHVGLGFR